MRRSSCKAHRNPTVICSSYTLTWHKNTSQHLLCLYLEGTKTSPQVRGSDQNALNRALKSHFRESLNYQTFLGAGFCPSPPSLLYAICWHLDTSGCWFINTLLEASAPLPCSNFVLWIYTGWAKSWLLQVLPNLRNGLKLWLVDFSLFPPSLAVLREHRAALSVHVLSALTWPFFRHATRPACYFGAGFLPCIHK